MTDEQFRMSKEHLRTVYQENDLKYLCGIRKTSRECYPDEGAHDWFLIQHLSAGMAIRNHLRNIISDSDIGGNWDDYYMNVLNGMLDDYESDCV